MHVCMHVCMYLFVCIYERERDRQTDRQTDRVSEYLGQGKRGSILPSSLFQLVMSVTSTIYCQ